MNINMNKNSISINGVNYTTSKVTINGDNVFIDGVQQTSIKEKTINIVVHGDVESINNDSGRVDAHSVHTIKTVSGDVDCEDVAGNVSTVSGDVDCMDVGGNVKTVSGDITHSKGE